MGEVETKPIRSWRIQAGLPFGLHVWFDPAEEHVLLLEGPDPRGRPSAGEQMVNVDTRSQHVLPLEKVTLSVSDSGKREASVENLNESAAQGDLDPAIPF